jgi:hypothetical protein
VAVKKGGASFNREAEAGAEFPENGETLRRTF